MVAVGQQNYWKELTSKLKETREARGSLTRGFSFS